MMFIVIQARRRQREALVDVSYGVAKAGIYFCAENAEYQYLGSLWIH